MGWRQSDPKSLTKKLEEIASYAETQGDRAKELADNSPVVSVNGKNGLVILDSTDVGAISLSEKETFVTVTKLNEHTTRKASKTEYGHIKVGDGLSVSNGVISAEIPDLTASDVNVADESNLFFSTNVEGALRELFINVSDGKSIVGTAITDLDSNVSVPTDPTFSQLANLIRTIKTGGKFATGTAYSYNPNQVGYEGYIDIVGLDFIPNIIFAYSSNTLSSLAIDFRRDEKFSQFASLGGFFGQRYGSSSAAAVSSDNRYNFEHDEVLNYYLGSIHYTNPVNSMFTWVAIE